MKTHAPIHPGEPTEEPLGQPENRQKKHFVYNHSDGWHATPAGIFNGNLFFTKSSDSYWAISFVRRDHLRKATQGFKTAEQSPIGAENEFKSEFLRVATVRLMSRYDFLLDENPSLYQKHLFLEFRRRTIFTDIKEREHQTGKSISENARANAESLIVSSTAFLEWCQALMMGVWLKEDAAEILARYAQWIRVIDRVLSEPPDPDDDRFLRAVEAAAAKCAGVPTSKAVETEFIQSRSHNQIGGGSTFRVIKNRLKFNWLPNSTPGPPSRKIDRARKSVT